MTYHANTFLTPSADRTIWYELHAREWPFKTQPAEAIIWQMGTGMKPNLSQIGMGKEISVSPGRCQVWGTRGAADTILVCLLFLCVKLTNAFPKGGGKKARPQLCPVMIWSLEASPLNYACNSGSCHQGRSSTWPGFCQQWTAESEQPENTSFFFLPD